MLLEVPLLRGIRGSPKTHPNSARCGWLALAWMCAGGQCSPVVWVRLWAAGICWSSAVIFSMRLSHRVGGSRVVPTPCARVPCSCSWLNNVYLYITKLHILPLICKKRKRFLNYLYAVSLRHPCIFSPSFLHRFIGIPTEFPRHLSSWGALISASNCT